MPKPTLEELQKINQFTLTPLTEDEVFVFEDLMIDNQETAYHSVIHENLLQKFMRDTDKGIGLLISHNSNRLPVGRSFEARFTEEFDEELNDYVKSVYGKFYIDLNRNTESGMTTDDIARAIDAGTVFASSIGFNAESWKCSICGNDIRDWFKCVHVPGKKYAVERDGVDVVEKCIVIVGEDGKGQIIENSLVYAGACGRASIIKNFSVDNVTDFRYGTTLRLVDNFKDIPLDATIYQFFTRDGSVIFCDTDERTGGMEQLKQRSEKELEIKQILTKFNLPITEEQLSSALQSLVDAQSQLTEKASALEQAQAEVGKLTVRVTELEEIQGRMQETIDELTVTNEELTAKAGLGDTYRQDLINKAIETGIRANGNAFKAEIFERFLNSLTVDEIKDVIAGFEEEVASKFKGVRTSAPKPTQDEEVTRDSFETEIEFRNFMADKAQEYAEEHGVSLIEATKLIYKKYSQDRGDN